MDLNISMILKITIMGNYYQNTNQEVHLILKRDNVNMIPVVVFVK